MHYMPPEWQPHEACLIIYPHNTGVFRSLPPSDGTVTPSPCEPARAEVRNVARAIRDHGKEDVVLFCNTQDDADELERTLVREDAVEGEAVAVSRENKITVTVCPSDDSWCRDTGPTFVFTGLSSLTPLQGRRRELTGLDWKFNAYGGPVHGCYWPCMLDQGVAKNVVSILNRDRHQSSPSSPSEINTDNNTDSNRIVPPGGSNDVDEIESKIAHSSIDMILEGGSFHTDGDGTILTTEECLLHPNRNPTLTKTDIERVLCKNLGATKVIWLPFGLAFDDDTNGHVDNIATFARPGEVVLSWTDEEEEGGGGDDCGGNYGRCRVAEEILREQVDAKGREIKIHKLYIPNRMHYTDEEVKGISAGERDDGVHDNEEEIAQAIERMTNQRLAASYVNYYLANHAIILPQFGDAVHDVKALETMQEIFLDRKVVGINSREILLGGGNIHCITQQVPLITEKGAEGIE